MLWTVVLLVALIGFALAGFVGAPWLPTRRRDVEKLLDDAGVRKGQTFLELGCGEGRLVAAAARRGAYAVGYEINPLLWFMAMVRTLRYYPRAKVRFANFWAVDLGAADVVMIFLIHRFMKRFEQKADAQMKAGSTLVSYVFALPSHPLAFRGERWYIYHF